MLLALDLLFPRHPPNLGRMNALAEFGVESNGFVDAVNAKQHSAFDVSFTLCQVGRNRCRQDAARSMSVVRSESWSFDQVVEIVTVQIVV